MERKTVLAGTGPGDIELVTIKTLNAVKEADIILYDALIPKELLDYTCGKTFDETGGN